MWRASDLMKSELVEQSAVRKELKIEIPAETVQAAHNRISQDYTRHANIAGFRQGRAPASIVKRRFKNEIASDVLREVIPAAVNQAISDHNLQPLGEPEVHLESAEGLQELGVATVMVHAHVEVMPEIVLGQYKGLAGVRRQRPVEDFMVDELVEEERGKEAALDPIEDRPAQDGDTVSVTLNGTFPNADGEDFELDTVDIEIGGADTLEEFSIALDGVVAGDTRACEVSYPDDFSTEDLAGKTVAYTFSVNEIYTKALPEVSDDWAQSLDKGYESAADMRDKLRAEIAQAFRNEADERLRSDLFNQLIEAHEIEMPNVLVEMQAERMLDNMVRNLSQRGLDPRNFKNEFWRSMLQSMRPQAEREVRGLLLLKQIGEDEGFMVTPDEIEAEIEKFAASVEQPLEEVRAVLTKDNGEQNIAEQLKNRRALDLLFENAVITEGEWQDPNQPSPEEIAETEAEGEAMALTTETAQDDVPANAEEDTTSEPAQKSESAG